MARLPNVASLFDSGLSVFTKEWKLLSFVIIVLSLPLYLLGLSTDESLTSFLAYLLVLGIISPLISMITVAITQYRYEKDKTIHGKALYSIIHDRFFPTLWTTILTAVIVSVIMSVFVLPAGILLLSSVVSGTLTLSSLSSATIAGLVLIGLMALVAIIGVGVYLMFALPATVIHKVSGFKAISESIKLVKGRWWNIFGKVVILQLISVAIVLIIELFANEIFGAELSGVALLVVSLLQQVAVLPVTLSFIVLYLDIKESPRKRDIGSTITHKHHVKKVAKAPLKKAVKKSSTKKKTSKKSSSKKVPAKKVTKKTTSKKSTKKTTAKKKSSSKKKK
jgi:membrane-anchored glycerophosphoryl diester phosphodiesterase (GDPDase)